MARWMVEKEAFVAVIEVKVLKRDEYGSLVKVSAYDYIGPYEKVSVAKAQLTVQRRERGRAFVDGWVERAVAWERID